MPVLLSSAALWTLAALALPLALHLWRQPPRTVLVGSVRFLRVHAGRRLYDLRWRERLLLASRLLLLALLALFLAKPVWWQRPSSRPQRWILLDPTAAPAGVSAERLRALKASGYATHLLAPGLPAVSHPALSSDGLPPDLWSLLQEADASLPAGSSLAVFSPLRLAALRGVRPALRSRPEWVQTPDAAGDAPHLWIESAKAAPAPAAMVGVSDASTLRFASTPPEGWRLETGTDGPRLRGPRGEETARTAPAPAPSLGVLILRDADRAEDAHYLAAAVRAVAEAGGAKLDLRALPTACDPTSLPPSTWTFWLSAQGVPDALRVPHGQLLRDCPTGGSPASGWLVPQSPIEPDDAPASGVRLWRRGPVPAGAAVWTDEHGSPLLTRANGTHGSRWEFASRFHPAWTDLPLSSAFPAFLRSLLLPETAFDPGHDLRRTVASQASPSTASAPSVFTRPPLATDQNHDLRPSLWALVALLFVLERWLSHREGPSDTVPAPPPSLEAATR